MTYQEAIDKAMKLLRLTKSPVPAEAALAASKAQEIIDHYKLDVTGLDYDKQEAADDNEPVKDFGYSDPLDNVKYGMYRETWCVRLASYVARHNHTRIVQTYAADGKGRVIKIIGRPSDVNTVRYLYPFFKIQIEEMANRDCVGHSSAYRGQYCAGVIDTLWAKLCASRQQTFTEKRTEMAGNQTALVRVNNAIAKMEKRSEAVDAYIKMNMKLGKGRGGYSRTETGGRREGQRAGQNIRMTGARGGLGAGRKQIN